MKLYFPLFPLSEMCVQFLFAPFPKVGLDMNPWSFSGCWMLTTCRRNSAVAFHFTLSLLFVWISIIVTTKSWHSEIVTLKKQTSFPDPVTEVTEINRNLQEQFVIARAKEQNAFWKRIKKHWEAILRIKGAFMMSYVMSNETV